MPTSLCGFLPSSLSRNDQTDSWMDLAPLLVDNADMNYRATMIQEHQRRTIAMQQEFNALQQEFQNNPQNPVFYRDDYGVPHACSDSL